MLRRAAAHARYWLRTLLFLWAAAAPPFVAIAAPNDKLGERKQELQLLMTQLEKVKKKLDKKQGKQTSTQKAFRRAEEKIGELAASGHRLTEQQQQLDQQLQKLHIEQAALEKKRDQQRELIGDHLNIAYRAGNQSALSLFFSEAGPAELDRQIHYLERINQARTQLIRDYATIITRNQFIGESIDKKQRQLNNNQATLAEQYLLLTKLQQQRQEILQQLDNEIGSGKEQIALLEREHMALQALIEEMAQLWQKQSLAPPRDSSSTAPGNRAATLNRLPGEFASAQGQLPWPVTGRRRRNFGNIRADSEIKSQGVTIAAASGSIVQAIYPGRVIFADWFGGQGLLTIVDHGDGYWSLYGHNQSLLKSVGARVSAGEAIATVGNSGGQSESALYFEIRQHGKPSDPALWCHKS